MISDPRSSGLIQTIDTELRLKIVVGGAGWTGVSAAKIDTERLDAEYPNSFRL